MPISPAAIERLFLVMYVILATRSRAQHDHAHFVSVEENTRFESLYCFENAAARCNYRDDIMARCGSQ